MGLPSFPSTYSTICFLTAVRPGRMDAVLFGGVLINDQTTLQGVQVLDANDGTIEKDADYCAQRQ